jgi:hypothetical protein
MLILHSGGRAIAAEDLHGIEVVRPEGASNRWAGTNHGVWRDAIVNAASHLKLEVEKESWGVDGDLKEDLWGVVEFKPREEEVKSLELVPGGMKYCIGTRHSNRRRFGHSIACGGRVLICDNGAVSGEYVIRRKHTVGCNVEELAEEGMKLWSDKIGGMRLMVEDMMNLDLTGSAGENEVNRVLVKSGERGVLGWGAVGKVLGEWRKPSHEEFEPRCGWSLYNAFTEVAKGYAPASQIRILNKSRDIILRKEENRAANAIAAIAGLPVLN